MMMSQSTLMKRSILAILAVFVLGTFGYGVEHLRAQAASQERTVWYFYRVKWGFQDEFVALFRKNHYPILKAQIGTRLVSVKTYAPTYHGDGRADWTFGVAITYRDTVAMTGPSPEADLARNLFPNQVAFRNEEKRRFELLDAHWDVPLNEVPMTAPPQ